MPAKEAVQHTARIAQSFQNQLEHKLQRDCRSITPEIKRELHVTQQSYVLLFMELIISNYFHQNLKEASTFPQGIPP